MNEISENIIGQPVIPSFKSDIRTSLKAQLASAPRGNTVARCWILILEKSSKEACGDKSPNPWSYFKGAWSWGIGSNVSDITRVDWKFRTNWLPACWACENQQRVQGEPLKFNRSYSNRYGGKPYCLVIWLPDEILLQNSSCITIYTSLWAIESSASSGQTVA